MEELASFSMYRTAECHWPDAHGIGLPMWRMHVKDSACLSGAYEVWTYLLTDILTQVIDCLDGLTGCTRAFVKWDCKATL